MEMKNGMVIALCVIENNFRKKEKRRRLLKILTGMLEF